MPHHGQNHSLLRAELLAGSDELAMDGSPIDHHLLHEPQRKW